MTSGIGGMIFRILLSQYYRIFKYLNSNFHSIICLIRKLSFFLLMKQRIIFVSLKVYANYFNDIKNTVKLLKFQNAIGSKRCIRILFPSF